MSNDNLDFGREAEETAARFLKNKGYKIILRNYKTRLGEIDIIAKDKEVLCFIEVKARRTDRFGSGKEAVSEFKKRQISKAALVFLKDKNLLNKPARFDVVAIGCRDEQPGIELFKNAFELSADYSL
ncbi:MAG: YraN family protein [Candidatus Omnitrophota bacterium]|nr:YraN family protein [Candidatus Omnitrophota bacterium]MBU1928887.1 YraN family protein [Candidatus Omnitrophota bacterium]MBU2034497.1 YraN family protein [Candidatus Omnitrophota bacterium]MBU2221327.1 YraN family protein [Candidatus Omnitrophota bacterium]MBU2257770.1 YraN family protein [Candidatus Omnitrophota bacterium]